MRFGQAVRLMWLALCAQTLLALPAQACRQALVLALDVSGSVNAVEYQQQVSGLAFALGDPDIRQLILDNPDQPVMLAVFEWSSQNHQYIVLPWTRLNSSAALDQAIRHISQHRKVRAGLKTALGTALQFGQAMLHQQAGCWQHTIDVSGDGRNNAGPTPRETYLQWNARTTVNALVVGEPDAESGEGPGIEPDALQQYYETEVIRGAGAFSIVANGYADYARAMRIKLERELQPLMVSTADQARSVSAVRRPMPADMR